MASILDMLGGLSGQTGSAAEFFRPILEAVAAEAKRKADPVQRLYDVGGAVFESAARGSPFSTNLAALEAERTKAITGAGNMFLTLLGQERQLKALESDQAYKNIQLQLQLQGLKPNFAKDMMALESQLAGRSDLTERDKQRMRDDFRVRWYQNYGSPTQPELRRPAGTESTVAPPATPRVAAAPPSKDMAGVPDYLTVLDKEGLLLLQDQLNIDPVYKAAPPAEKRRLEQKYAQEIYQARTGLPPGVEKRGETYEILKPPVAQADLTPKTRQKVEEIEAKKEVERRLKAQTPKFAEHIVAQELEKVLDATKDEAFTTGMVASGLQYLPSSPAYKVRQSLETVKGRVSLAELQKLRDEATSGASGLGQVTEREHAMLQKAIGPLEVGLGKDLAPNALRALRVFRAITLLPYGPEGLTAGMEAAVLRGDYDKQLGIDPGKYGIKAPSAGTEGAMPGIKWRIVK